MKVWPSLPETEIFYIFVLFFPLGMQTRERVHRAHSVLPFLKKKEKKIDTTGAAQAPPVRENWTSFWQKTPYVVSHLY